MFLPILLILRETKFFYSIFYYFIYIKHTYTWHTVKAKYVFFSPLAYIIQGFLNFSKYFCVFRKLVSKTFVNTRPKLVTSEQ